MTVSVRHTENEAGMAALAAEGQRFMLAYLDPPFFTQRTFTMPDGEVAFEDRWSDLEEYVRTVARVATAAWSLVEPGGSLVLHVDPSTSHYLKVKLDEKFGRLTFANEIIWRYRRWPSPATAFQWMHDVLLRWVKPGAEPRFVQLYEPLSATTMAYTKGRRQVGVKREDGTRGQRYGDEESLGAHLSDVWEIPIVAPSGHERVGYPTQKPEALLARLVSSLTHEGDWVLDPYMGSGTTLAVAHRFGRHAVGLDRSKVAVRVAQERLAPLLAQVSLFGGAG